MGFNMRAFNALNGLIYSFGWVFCILCGASHLTLPPLIFTLIAVIAQLYFLYKQDQKVYYADLLVLLYGVSFGYFMEIALISNGIVTYATENRFFALFPPGWIWSLYFLFSLTFNHSLKFLHAYRVLPFLFGALGGPISYLVGQRLGAVTLSSDAALLFLGALWGVYLFVMYEFTSRINHSTEKLLSSENLNLPFTIFYDSICPICNKEIGHLKNRKLTGKIKFCDLVKNKEIKEVDYFEAMKEIHALGPQGQVLKGIDAFSQLYARANLPFLAVLLQAPLVYPVAKFFYSYWAKYRLYNRCKIQDIR